MVDLLIRYNNNVVLTCYDIRLISLVTLVATCPWSDLKTMVLVGLTEIIHDQVLPMGPCLSPGRSSHVCDIMVYNMPEW